MILNRLGNKKKIADEIQKYFPAHSVYIEPFFGAGGMFFSKPKAQYNILNDNDSEVFNLFMVLMNKKDELYDTIYKMPIDETLFLHWQKNKETTDVLRACRFLLLSNFGYMGKPNTIRFRNGNLKELLLSRIATTYKLIWDCEFMCTDFRNVFKKIPVKDDEENLFAYLDPPYLGTDDNYEMNFNESDSFDLFDLTGSRSIKWAMSEFNHPFILQQAKERNLNIHYIGERQNMKNRRIEILITNYQIPQLKLF